MHSRSSLKAGLELAFGSPLRMRARMRSGFSGRSDMKSRISLLTHAERAELGEQSTIRKREAPSAAWMAGPKWAEPESSSRSRKTGRRNFPSISPSMISVPRKSFGIG